MDVSRQIIATLMKREGVSQAELARRLGSTRQKVNSMLVENSDRSMLVSELARYVGALGYELELEVTRKEEVNSWRL